MYNPLLPTESQLDELDEEPEYAPVFEDIEDWDPLEWTLDPELC